MENDIIPKLLTEQPGPQEVAELRKLADDRSKQDNNEPRQ